MPVPIAELFVSVSADVSAATRGLQSLGTQLDTTRNRFEQARPAAIALAGAGAAIGAGFATSINVAADFERQMSGVRAVLSPVEARQFGAALDELAISLGADTAFNAIQTAAAIEELIKAGVSAPAVLGGAAKAALDLAAATGAAPAEAALIAAQAMNAFKVSVEELPTVVDRLSGVVNVSAADMGDLRLGLQQVGAVASLAGFSFEDTITAIGALANAGVRGSDAGTSLKTMFLNLIPTTKRQKDEFTRLGLITANGANAFFDATGRVKSLAGVAGVLNKAMAGMTHQQRLATAEILFGSDAMRAGAILSEQGADGINQLQGAIRQISAADQAAERLNNLFGALEQLGGAIQSVQIRIGRLFLPEIRAITEAVTRAVKAFGAMPPETQRTIAIFVALAGAVAAAAGGFVLLAPFIANLLPAFRALGLILAGVSPFLLVLAAAGAALYAAWQSNFGGIQEIVANAFAAVPGIIERVGPILTSFAENVLPRLQSAAEGIGRFWDTELSPALGRLGRFIETEVAPKIKTFVEGALPTLISVAEGVRLFWDTQLSPAFGAFAKFLEGDVAPKIQAFVEGVVPTLTSSAESVRQFWDEHLQPAFGRLVEFIQTDVATAFAAVGIGLDQLASEKGPQAVSFLDSLGQSLSAFGAEQVAALTPFFQSIGNLFSSIGNFASALGELFAPLGDAARQPIDQLGTVLGGLLATMASQEPLLASLTKTFNDAAGAFNALAEGIRALAAVEPPQWLTDFLAALTPFGDTRNFPGVQGPQGGRGGFTPTSFTFGTPVTAGAGGGGDIIIQGDLNIGSEVDADNFLSRMAALLNGSANRVNSPPDNSGNPALRTEFT